MVCSGIFVVVNWFTSKLVVVVVSVKVFVVCSGIFVVVNWFKSKLVVVVVVSV